MELNNSEDMMTLIYVLAMLPWNGAFDVSCSSRAQVGNSFEASKPIKLT